MPRLIRHEFFYAHSPETVWDYLTKPELMEQWLMKTDFQPIIGLDFQFRTDPIPSLNFDGIFYCKVLQFVPFKRLSYSWKTGPGNGEITLESVVLWKLEPRADGTALLLEHSGFEQEENLNFFKGLTEGWLEKLRLMEQLLNAPRGGTIIA